MNYTNLDSRLKLHSLSPAFLRRLKRIREASIKSRATKKTTVVITTQATAAP